MPSTAEIALLIRAKDEASKEIEKTKGSISGLSKTAKTALLGVGLAADGVGIAAIKMGIDFERSKAEVASRSSLGSCGFLSVTLRLLGSSNRRCGASRVACSRRSPS